MKDKKYVIFLVALIALYVVSEMRKSGQVNWSSTYHEEHKIPFGAFAMHDLMSDMFDQAPPKSEYKTLYELAVEDSTMGNPLIIADGVAMDNNDFNALMRHIDLGGTALISARNIQGPLADSLGFIVRMEDAELAYDFRAIQEALSGELEETITLNLTDNETKEFSYSTIATTSYFSQIEKENFDVLAVNATNSPVLISYKGMKGSLYVSTIPLVFTNYFILGEETSQFAAAMLSLFPEDELVVHNEYYQLGRREVQSPLRVILSNPSLKWAFFILLFTVFIFMFFESKRRQRIIPLITPLKNMSVEFVETLGRLYYRQKDHRKLAVKRVQYWKDYVRVHFNLKTDHFGDRFNTDLSSKSGQPLKSIEALMELVKRIEEGAVISEDELIKLEKGLNGFYGIE
ncbi:hypothetical protein BFP97_17000 [Roseivirga sp. 4D4]|uniref:DUF4350 domain-containing protein n=1 Tax=Roseivirga sp. 4D4 TaxID=1889784 RepID=UPI00085343C6|nr:DUF4350 domain-containing protein [Roseivirga sp. 4D4]OEK03114.1 hypothetical protein BFP97_17000 [Roseivirga sp. 4D4]